MIIAPNLTLIDMLVWTSNRKSSMQWQNNTWSMLANKLLGFLVWSLCIKEISPGVYFIPSILYQLLSLEFKAIWNVQKLKFAKGRGPSNNNGDKVLKKWLNDLMSMGIKCIATAKFSPMFLYYIIFSEIRELARCYFVTPSLI